jgi:ABC-type amino acid transport substrate-binding protein
MKNSDIITKRFFVRREMVMSWKKIRVLSAIFIILLAILSEPGIAGTLQEIKERGRLIAGVKTDFPPFGFLDEKGANKGLDIDIARILARELFGKETAVEFVPVTSESRIPVLKSGKVDVLIASMTITEERKKQIDFSIPYFISGHLILVPRGSKIIRYQDLAGKKVATVLGSTGDKVIGELVPTAMRVKFQRNSEALEALKEGRVDAFVQDDVLIIEFQQKNPDLKIAGFQPFRPAPYGIGVRKGDKEWLEFINATLTKMKKNGEYHKLLDKWFGRVRTFLLKLEGY